MNNSNDGILDQGYDRLTDIPLDNYAVVRKLFKHWYYLQEAKYTNTGAHITIMELERRYYSADLTDNHRSAVRWNLIEGRTQSETGEIMNASPRWVGRLVTEAIRRMSMFDNEDGAEVVPLFDEEEELID